MTAETPTASGSGWRQRWVDEQNEAKRRAYDTALRSWRRQDDELKQLRSLATRFQGSTDPAMAPWLQLGRDEVVLCAMPNVRLVEAPHVGALPAPDLTRFPFPLDAEGRGKLLLPPGITATDTGTVVITSRRMVFRGERTKSEWVFSRLDGVTHDRSAPFTLIRVVYREQVSGLLVPEGQVENFRFNLTLAIAHANGDRTAFVAHLDNLVAAHQRIAPIAPVPVTPQDAPLKVMLARSRVALAGVGVVVLLIGVIFGVQALGGGDAPPAAATATSGPPLVDAGVLTDGPTETQDAPTTATSTPTPTPSQTLSKTPSKKPTPSKTPSKSTTPTPKRTTASPTPPKVDLCGAPQNPFGYTFCRGGSLIFNAKSGVCSYFSCVGDFPDSRGFLVQCRDGKISMSGGQRRSCSRHDGPSRPVYQ